MAAIAHALREAGGGRVGWVGDDLAFEDVESGILSVHVEGELGAEVFHFERGRVEEKALGGWRDVGAETAGVAARLPGREDFQMGAAFNQEAGAAKELDLS